MRKTVENSADLLQKGLAFHQDGDLGSASRCYEDVLHSQPDHPDATRMQAYIAMQRGQLDDAERLARKSLASDPQSAPSHNTLGKVLIKQGRFDEASDAFICAVELDGELLDARINLARTCRCTGRSERAIDILTSADVSIGDDGNLCTEVAMTFNSMGRYEEAERYFHAALDNLPGSAENHSNLGEFYLDQGKPAIAVEYLKRAVEMLPGRVEVRTNLAMALRVLGDLPAALDCLRVVLSLQPGNPAAAALAATVLHLMGEYAESRILYEAILGAYPRHEAALSGLAGLLEVSGEYETAIELLQPAANLLETKPVVTVTYARILRHVDRQKEATSILQDLLKAQETGWVGNPLLTKQIHFTLADLYDDQKDYEAAWNHYIEANRSHWVKFNMQTHLNVVNSTIEAFSPEALTRLSRSSQEGIEPIFILGMPRSGTSLVDQILAMHPEIHALGENMLIRNIAVHCYPGHVGRVTVDDLNEASQKYLMPDEPVDSCARRITDKTTGNFQFLGLIEMLFPNAKIIHCSRNPLDTMLSCYFTDFTDPALAYTFDLQQLGDYYKHYQRLMDHWKQVLRLPILDLCYEDLVTDPEAKMRELIEFTGLSWDPGCLEFYRSDRIVQSASFAQVKKPIYTSSVGRSSNYPYFLEGVSP